MYIRLHVKYPLFLWDFNETNFLDRFWKKKLKYQISLKNPSSGSQVAPCGRMDGRTDCRIHTHKETSICSFATEL